MGDVLRFDDAVIDVPRRQLIVGGEVRHLEPQAFDLLVYLVSHRDRVVPKHELLDEVWGDQFFSESALTTRIKEIRRALGDDGTRQAFVRNFRGRGYRFVAEPTVRAGTVEGPGDVVGRDHDIDTTFVAIEHAPLVTLVGPGGVGKTTLANEVARLAPDRWAGRRDVQVVELAAVRDEGGLRRAFERGCGISDPALDDESLADAIAQLDALVIVDNCEHLVAAVARFVERVVRRGGPVRLLATSRERLGVQQEQVRRVEPLDTASARRLLVARARAARSDVVVDDESVERLVSMLDHLPLAIEMAAAHLAALGADELVDVLGQRLDLLRSANRGAVDRHRTLVEVIEWSERLLSPAAARLLTDLSVFAGPVSADDIAAVAGTSAGELLLGPLSELVEHSLVVADSTVAATCYRLLGTVRAVVGTRRHPSVDERHARHVATSVDGADRQLRGPHEALGVARIASLEAEIGTAHRWARQHDHALAARLTTSLLHYAHERLWNEPAVWARELLDDPALTVDLRPFAAAAAADASNRDDVDDAVRLATAAVDSGDPRVAASAHDTLANVGMYTGDLTLSSEHGAAQVDIGARVGDTTMQTFGILSEVLADVYGGDLAAARRTFEARPSVGPASVTSTAWLSYGEGELLAAEGDDLGAIDRFRRAVELGESVDNRFVVGVAQVAELAARTRAGDAADSLRAFEEVLVRYRRQHDVTHAVTALRNLIVLLVREGRDEPAMRLLGALSAPTVKATYGAESATLAEARATAADRCGSDRVERWIAEGRGRDTSWALDTAIELLADSES